MKSNTYPTLTPSIAVRDAAEALTFYRKAFGAVERYRLVDPENGKIGHAEMSVRDGLLMLADEYPEYNKAPDTIGGSATRLCLQLETASEVDAVYEQALSVGAQAVRPPSDQFYGHRSACLRDPFGHEWMLFCELEVLSPAEMQRRWDAMAQRE